MMNKTNTIFDTCAVVKLLDNNAIFSRRGSIIVLGAALLIDNDRLLKLFYPCLRARNIF